MYESQTRTCIKTEDHYTGWLRTLNSITCYTRIQIIQNEKLAHNTTLL